MIRFSQSQLSRHLQSKGTPVGVETEKVHSDRLVESGCVRNVSVEKVQC